MGEREDGGRFLSVPLLPHHNLVPVSFFLPEAVKAAKTNAVASSYTRLKEKGNEKSNFALSFSFRHIFVLLLISKVARNSGHK